MAAPSLGRPGHTDGYLRPNAELEAHGLLGRKGFPEGMTAAAAGLSHTFRRTAFCGRASYFRHYAELSDADAEAEARRIWRSINEVNLLEHILPTRERASLVLTKGPDHAVTQVRLRRG